MIIVSISFVSIRLQLHYIPFDFTDFQRILRILAILTVMLLMNCYIRKKCCLNHSSHSLFYLGISSNINRDDINRDINRDDLHLT